jgi:hypothetical protein
MLQPILTNNKCPTTIHESLLDGTTGKRTICN